MSRCLIFMLFLFLLAITHHSTGEENDKANGSDSSTQFEGGQPSCFPSWIPLAAPGASKYSHCLKLFPIFRMSWQEAEESCTQLGSDTHLLSIQKAEQIHWLNEAIDAQSQLSPTTIAKSSPHRINSDWWIGLGQLCPKFQINQMPILRWTDGSSFDNKKRESTIGDLKLNVPKLDKWDDHYCVSYHYEKAASGTESSNYFNLTECSGRRNFICQRPAFSQGRIDEEIIAEQRTKSVKKEENEQLTEEHPCGKDPMYCALRTSRGTVCYHLQTRLHYWEQASEECDAQYQSDLTSVHSKEEINFIYKMVQLQPTVTGETKYWIGLHRRNTQGQYEWSDGSPFDYMIQQTANEDLDEENGACVALQFNIRLYEVAAVKGTTRADRKETPRFAAYSWIHQRCDKRHLAICRKPGFDYSNVKLNSTKDEQRMKKHSNWKCPDGYKLFRRMCYKVFGKKDTGITFSEAIKSCRNEKANLASLSDIYENGFVVSLLQGLRSNAWIGMDMSDGRVRWLDGEPLKLTRFSPDKRVIRIGEDRHVFHSNGQPNFSREACVALDATNMVGYWDIIFNTTTGVENKPTQCESTKLPYICETYADESSSNAIKRKRICHEIDDVTYCFLLNDPNKDVNGYYSFMDASEICAALPKLDEFKNLSMHYGQLAEADNLFEWSFLTALALENDYDEFFIGVRFRKSVGFERIDKLRLHLTPWGVGEPKLKNGDCVVLKIGKDGPAWYMEDCMKHKPVVCRLSKEEPMSEIPQLVRCPNGKEDWILGETQCYHLVSNVSLISSGFKADHDCFKYFNAHLASFETREDFEQFRSHILHNQLSVSNAIIGLIRQQHGSYAWKDSSPVTFLNWAEGEPADAKGRIAQECVQMQLSGNYTWHSVTCWQTRHFLCSVPVVNAYEEPKKEDKGQLSSSPLPKTENDKAEEDKKMEKEELSGGGSTAGNANRGDDGDDDQSAKASAPSSKTSAASNPFGSIIGICAFLAVITITVSTVYLWRRKRRLRITRQRIIQFDSLQNEEDGI